MNIYLFIAVILKLYTSINWYRNILFWWPNQNSFRYEINSLVLDSSNNTIAFKVFSHNFDPYILDLACLHFENVCYWSAGKFSFMLCSCCVFFSINSLHFYQKMCSLEMVQSVYTKLKSKTIFWDFATKLRSILISSPFLNFIDRVL